MDFVQTVPQKTAVSDVSPVGCGTVCQVDSIMNHKRNVLIYTGGMTRTRPNVRNNNSFMLVFQQNNKTIFIGQAIILGKITAFP